MEDYTPNDTGGCRSPSSSRRGRPRRFASLLQSLLPDLAPAEAERRLRQACELIEWARRNLCAARGRIAEEILRLETLRIYHSRLSMAGYTLKIEG